MDGLSVVMACNLGYYEGGASDRINKFKRSVDSFLNQNYNGRKELIIVSDGCELTKEVLMDLYPNENQILLLMMKKQPPYGGQLRNKGIEFSTFNTICYLDSDDYLMPEHLENISLNFNQEHNDWVYFDYWIKNNSGLNKRLSTLNFGGVGTSSFCHKKMCDVKWIDGWGHDWNFINKLIQKYHKHEKIDNGGYVVCHIKGCIDV